MKTKINEKSTIGLNGLNVHIKSHYGGLQWKYENPKTKEWLSVILTIGSFGFREGLFEIYPSWRRIESTEKGSVDGYLNFGEVQAWIDELKKRGE